MGLVTPEGGQIRSTLKHRSLSISNAVLARLRLAGKHVAFDSNGDVVLKSESMSPESPISPCSSPESDEDTADLLPGADVPENVSAPVDNEALARKLKSVALAASSKRSPSKQHMLILKKYRSHPHNHSSSGRGLPLEPLFYSLQHSNTNLPEFNKRPLTDTPIVSSMASPETKYHSSDEEDDLFPYFKTANDEMPQHRKLSAHLSKEQLRKTTNISHLNLSDLNLSLSENTDASPDALGADAVRMDSISPTNTLEAVHVEPPKIDPLASSTLKYENAPPPPRIETLPPVPTIGQETPPAALDQLTENLLQDIPPELQQQFKKTPSFEQLKTILLLKTKKKNRKAYTLNIPGQTSSKTSPDGKIASVDVGSKLVIVMVGLPARGKSYITNKLTRYLNWIQHDCRVFNVGNTRRMDKTNVLGPASRPLPDTNTPLPFSGRSPVAAAAKSPTSHSADFFNPQNKESTEIREKWAMDTLDSLLDWVVNGPGSVGILDATNSTKKRRLKVLKRIQEKTNGELKVLFLESICSDPAIIDTNIRLKLSGPDYKDMDRELALKDFLGRLRNYEKGYETIDETEEAIPGFQYVKMINVGKKVVSYGVQGFLASQTIYFLLNFNLCERQIWLTRHGESVDNLSGRIGGDSKLTKRGIQFSKALSRFLSYQRQQFRKKQLEKFSSRLELRYNELLRNQSPDAMAYEHGVEVPTEPNFCVWTSMLLRAIETGNAFNDQDYNVKAMRMLNELGGGMFEGMTYDEIRRKEPKEYESRLRTKLTYRYPGVGGESYLDVLVRLKPLINEIERTTDHLLIVSHRVVLRVLLAYFLNLDKSSIVELDVPLHTLFCLDMNPYGNDYKMFEYDEGTDWFRSIEPEHQKNVKEVGVNFRERKYSVIPTAPPSAGRNRRGFTMGGESTKKNLSNFSVRKSLRDKGEDLIDEQDRVSFNSSSSRKLADLIKLRKP